MRYDIHFVVLVAGVLLTLFGGSVVLSDRFFAWMTKNVWKGSDQERRLWSTEGIRNFNRYGRGLGSLLAGIVLLIYSLVYYASK